MHADLTPFIPNNLRIFLELFESRGKTAADFENLNGFIPGYTQGLINQNHDLPSPLVLELFVKYSDYLSTLNYILLDIDGDSSRFEFATLNFNPHEEDTNEWTDEEIDKYLHRKDILSKELN